VDSAASGGPPVTYESLVEYLNETHRDHPGVGCAVGALAPDLAPTSKRARGTLIVGGMVTSRIHVLILVRVFFAFMKERALRRETSRTPMDTAEE
jgi:hypothetical protein